LNSDRFHEYLDDVRGYPTDEDQRAAIDHERGPLWLLAGPGSGKSEVLVTRTLKLICVDDIDPGSILLTTFTKKAGRNLEDRLLTYLSGLQQAEPTLQEIDLSDMRIGTLHSLCNDILLEYRYGGYRNVRLLDDVEQHLFAYRNAEIAKYDDHSFWTHFEDVVSRWWSTSSYPPNRWQRVRAAVILFNRIVEDLVDPEKLIDAGGHWKTLAEFYLQYVRALDERYRCDFAHLQSRFLEFLESPAGKLFLNGDDRRPLLHILVDEYQDTNPIQERIYLALAENSPHNLTVVGDDDQALYRFRGGTVSCMVNFGQACGELFDSAPTTIQLRSNYRSHPEIVGFFSDYITSFPEMDEPNVRAPGKDDMLSGASIDGDYPAVSWITDVKAGNLPGRLASVVVDYLLNDEVLADPSQCVVLMRSTKDSPGYAGPFLQALESRLADEGLDIPIYNPRSKSFMESEEVQSLLASLIHVIDQEHTFHSNRTRDLPKTVQEWVNTLDRVRGQPETETDALDEYIEKSVDNLRNRCKQDPNTFLHITLSEIVYRIMAFEPFRTWRQDPERNLRLAKVTRLFESYHSFNLDTLRSDPSGAGIDEGFHNTFYNMFVTYLMETGIDEDEDEDVIVPPGRLPFMTIHQAKGLEFPFVILGKVGGKPWMGAAQILENRLAPYRNDLYERPTRAPEDLAIEDEIRLHYVAYSRAQYGLIITGTPKQLSNGVAVPDRDAEKFRRNYQMI
jgi:DNA helicase II / ATP-dependent DNA helicase PcrA